MKKLWLIAFMIVAFCSFCLQQDSALYKAHYITSLTDFDHQQHLLLDQINHVDQFNEHEKQDLKRQIAATRLKLKGMDFWLRYLQPTDYKKLNGPLPVEWENEVFEKHEKPYRRVGAGLSLAEIYLAGSNINKDTLANLISSSITTMNVYRADSSTTQLDKFDNFFLCNRLYLLNLASIYTTGFDCPDNAKVIPELRSMLTNVAGIYTSYNQAFPAHPLTKDYLMLYERMISFADHQPADYELFDHFTFIKDYVNPLFGINQKLITQYGVVSTSFNDYTLNNTNTSIFDKSLYTAQNPKGIYSLIDNPNSLAEIRAVGKLLFYDPLLSGNNSRSCASCHKPKEYFTDTSVATAFNFDKKQRLPRNTPTLINVIYHHLIMLDGKHLSLRNQAMDVMTNSAEMSGTDKDLLEKVLSCKEYKAAFRKLSKLTPEEKEITMDHVVSAITYYYSSFSNYYAPFDDAMNHNRPLDTQAVHGFNLFMSKGKCATCHFIPQFNGVPAPYVSSEFEVVGTPADTLYSKLSDDKGRYLVNPAFETNGAFRTSTIRNASFTKPYMHNGVFTTLDQVIDFYDAGGASGRKMNIANQTLPPDSLHLTPLEKKDLVLFIKSLNENIIFEEPPASLPRSSNEALNSRKVGGEY